MEFMTFVDIPKATFRIMPCEKMLFIGSCFADNIGKRFQQQQFQADVNPFGVMYNPISVLHTIERLHSTQSLSHRIVLITLGTNHVYREKATGEIVDNCQKRPQQLFQEEVLTTDECVSALKESISLLKLAGVEHIIITVSPIRYKKYGYHESQLSKATLLLSADEVCKSYENVHYFPAYEILNDQLRDYRYYDTDMLHPSQQAVDFIYERFADTYFSDETHTFLKKWQPIYDALNHRPFNAESEEYKAFKLKTLEKFEELKKIYPSLHL